MRADALKERIVKNLLLEMDVLGIFLFSKTLRIHLLERHLFSKRVKMEAEA